MKSLAVVQVIRLKGNGYDASMNCQTVRFKFTASMHGPKATRFCFMYLKKRKVIIGA